MQQSPAQVGARKQQPRRARAITAIKDVEGESERARERKSERVRERGTGGKGGREGRE